MALDGSVSSQDSEKTSAETQGTSKETPTFTESQFRETVKKAVSDALSAAGRDAKSIQEQRKLIQKDLEDLERKRNEIEQADLANLEGDPEGQSLYKLKREYAKLVAKSVKDEDELQTLRQKDQITGLERKAKEIAEEYGVNHEDLLNLTDGTPEKMEALAKKLATKPSLKTDSGKTIGGGGIKSFSITGIKEQQLKIAKEKDSRKRAELMQELDEAWKGNRII